MEDVKKYNRTEYMRKYMKEYNKRIDSETGKTNFDKYYEYITCDLCGYKYAKNGKTNHYRTNKHKIGALNKKIEQLEQNNCLN